MRASAHIVFVGALCLLFGQATIARAEPTTDELKQQIAELKQRLQKLDERISVQEARAKKRPAELGLGPDGFFLGNKDEFQLRLRTVLQADGRAYLDEPYRVNDTFLIRRARLYVEGTIGDFVDYRLMPDFAGSQVVLFDAWINLRFWRFLQLRAGKFKTPFSLERLQQEQFLVFIERSLVSVLAPDRDIGVDLHGSALDDTLSWDLAAVNGAPDGASVDLDNDYSKDLVVRLFTHPLKPLHRRWLERLGLGFAASYGKERGLASNTGVTNFRTVGQLVFFNWIVDPRLTNTVETRGNRYRLDGQLYYFGGPVGLLAEYVYSSTQLASGSNLGTVGNQAWNVQLSFVLTLEDASYEGVVPKKPFDMHLHHAGAFEVAARVDQLLVDPAAFPVFADPTLSAESALEWALELNWYLTRNVRFMTMFARTVFHGGAATGDRAPEDVLFGRLQVAF